MHRVYTELNVDYLVLNYLQMKVCTRITILFIILGLFIGVQERSDYFQSKKINSQNRITHLNELSISDKLNYELIGKLGKPTKSRCNIYFGYKVNIVLRNKSNDTLKYIDWDCGSHVWNINNDNLKVHTPNDFEFCGTCDRNMIVIFEVPPHKIKSLYVYVNRKKNFRQKCNFKIGMILQRVIKDKDFYFYDYYFLRHNLSDQKINIIWSNSIELP